MMPLCTLLLFIFPLFSSAAMASEVSSSTPTADAEELEKQHINAWLVLKVSDRDAASKALIEKSVSLNGYYASRTEAQLSLKLPRKAVKSFLSFAESQGHIADRRFGSRSMSQALGDVGAKLKAREQLLEKYFKLLENAGSEAVIAVEKEVIRLVSEIETLKGRQRKMNHQAAFSDVRIDFQFQDRRAPVPDGSSSFEWLNTLNMAAMVREFQYNYAKERDCWLKADVPKGFAKYDFGSDVRGATPDNVLYRVRRHAHKPKASLAFWAEALVNRMAAAGYKTQGKLIDIGKSAKLIKLSAPFGSEDYAYWVAFGLRDSKIKIVEAVGELGALNTTHGDNILNQLQKEFAN